MGDSASAASATVDSLSMTHSTPPPPANAAEPSTALATPLESLYTPALDSSLDMTCTPVSRGRAKRVSPLQKMNEFLKSRDISPVCYPATIPWSEASARTRRRHLRKARQAVGAVLGEVAPHQSGQLWKALTTYRSLEHEDSSSSEEDAEVDIDEVLMSALADCYNNSSTWQVRRQVLSIVADKLTFRTIRRWIPDLTRYRFTTARDHALRYGRGVVPSPIVHTKMFVSQTQVDHFLDFITSPHVIQDLPFGQRSIKLSTNEVVIVPNVVRMMIPESIVKQYLAYAEESNFDPLSRRTLLNILSVCSASARKSLQGLDYVSSNGAQAFDDLCGVAQRLGDDFMGMSWAREQKEHLKNTKRYLKSDFKVRTAIFFF